MCRFSRLYQNLQSAYAAGVAVTDEASAMERAGEIMLMVQGRADNIKITCPEDMQPLSTQNQDRNLHLSTIHSF
jgi:2-C-methyl-D-erythritol 4-phosphate cytidylyltransferase